MDRRVLSVIRNNPNIYNLLRDESYHYIYLYRDPNYLRTLEKIAKEKYKIKYTDRIDKLSNNLELIKTFLDVL